MRTCPSVGGLGREYSICGPNNRIHTKKWTERSRKMASTTVAKRKLTVELPVEIVERLQETSARTKRTPDEIIAGSLITTLPASRRRAKEKVDNLFRRFATLSDQELDARLNTQLSKGELDRLSVLQDRNGE